MKRLTSVRNVKDAYTRRILGNILGKDPVAIYKRTPARLEALVRGCSKRELWKPAPWGGWPIAAIVSHLCDAEWVVGYRIRKILGEPGTRLEAYDQDNWASRLHYEKLDVHERVRLFVALRRANVALLQVLTPKEWKLFGNHSERGKETIERTVQMLAGHDVNHLRQIAKIRRMLN